MTRDPIIDRAEEDVKKMIKGKKEEKVQYIADFKGLIDVVLDNGVTKFLLTNGEVVDKAEIEDVVYSPPKKESLAFQLPDYKGILETSSLHSSDGSDALGGSEGNDGCLQDLKLFEDLIEYHKESSELPDEKLYVLMAAWDFHTHLLEKFDYSPILFFGGLPEKGKSRMARSLIYVSRRGIIKASISDAQLIREAKDHNASIFFDMTNFWKSIERSGSEDIILSRFEKGLKVARVKYPEKGAFEDMVYYSVFGPSIIGSNEPLDQILGTRVITIIMRQATRKFKKVVNEDKGTKLRNALVAWRLNHFNDSIPETEKITNGRFGDILQPLHQIILMVAPKYEADFKEVVAQLDKRRLASKADSLEAEIVLAILALRDKVEKGIVAVKDITDTLNFDRDLKDKIDYSKIGRKLNMMGYEKARTKTGASAIMWRESLNNALASEHDLVTPSATIKPSEPSVTISSKYNNNNNNKEELQGTLLDKDKEEEDTWTEPPIEL